MNDDGTLSCSTLGGSCAFAGTTAPTPQTTSFQVVSSATTSALSRQASAQPSTSSNAAQQQTTAPPAIPSIRCLRKRFELNSFFAFMFCTVSKNLPPFSMIFSLVGKQTVNIPAGTPYSKCPDGVIVGCDQGVRATLYTPGDLNNQVYACLDKAKAAGIASPGTYAAVGLLYCGINTAVPGSYLITYLVNSGSGNSVTASRTVTVLSVCESGQQQCSDGSCQDCKCLNHDWPCMVMRLLTCVTICSLPV